MQWITQRDTESDWSGESQQTCAVPFHCWLERCEGTEAPFVKRRGDSACESKQEQKLQAGAVNTGFNLQRPGPHQEVAHGFDEHEERGAGEEHHGRERQPQEPRPEGR